MKYFYLTSNCFARYRSAFFTVFLILGMMLSSCEKALELDYPDFLLSQENVFENAAIVNAAFANIYSGLRDGSPMAGDTYGMSVLLGLYTDELDYYQTNSPTDNSFYNHSVLPINSGVQAWWENSYALIYQINSIVEGLEHAPLADAEKEGFLGEALCLRGYIHFCLAQLFGDIPYIKTTDYLVNSSVSRMPLEAVYEEIATDLIEAKSLLPDVDWSGERTRVSKSISMAILARLYQVQQQWDKAFEESNGIITGGLYALESDLNLEFLKESTATLWQLKPEYAGSATKEGELFIFDFGPPYLYALTETFMSEFEAGDLRKNIWTREITDGDVSWFHPFKYKQHSFEANSTEYSILFRLAEQYLIRAEASLRLGNIPEAKDDIDIIRLRAGLPPTQATSAEAVMEEILRQKRYEFFTEQGHRWWDLKRTGMADQILSPIKSGWKTTDLLFPLPQKELVLNPNLNPQNPGY